MNRAYLLIGGNMGDRESLQNRVLTLISEYPCQIVQQSSLYETQAWGKTDQPSFLNRCLCIETEMEPEALLTAMLKIEDSLGRVRSEKYGPRTIDIDLLLFNDLVYASDSLTLPHPGLPSRRFALEPLREIAPDLVHPSLQLSIREMLSCCEDTLEVKKMD